MATMKEIVNKCPCSLVCTLRWPCNPAEYTWLGIILKSDKRLLNQMF